MCRCSSVISRLWASFYLWTVLTCPCSELPFVARAFRQDEFQFYLTRVQCSRGAGKWNWHEGRTGPLTWSPNTFVRTAGIGGGGGRRVEGELLGLHWQPGPFVEKWTCPRALWCFWPDREKGSVDRIFVFSGPKSLPVDTSAPNGNISALVARQ